MTKEATKLTVRVYADDILIEETEDHRVVSAVMNWIVSHRGEEMINQTSDGETK